MYNVQDYSFLYDNAVCPVIIEDWHFTHMLERTCMTASFYYEGKLGPIKPA